MLVVICLSFVGLLYATTDECEPCEEGDPNCGGEPGEDSVTLLIGIKRSISTQLKLKKSVRILQKIIMMVKQRSALIN